MTGAICYRKSVCLSVHLSVTRVDQSKMVEVRIMQFSPYSSPIPLVFALQVSSRNSDGIPPSMGVEQWWVAFMRETSYFRSSNAFARWLDKLDLLSQLRCPTSNVFARWRHCRVLITASVGLSCYLLLP